MFLELLASHGIHAVADVRRFPGSRKYPQFGQDALRASLAGAGIGYLWLPALGGRRRPRPDSRNTVWRNASFRGYADHMDTPAYRAALDQIVERAERQIQAVMCAEAVPWRCHRNLLADALLARGMDVRHIIQPGKANPHTLNKDAQVVAGHHVVYGPRVDQMDLL